MALLGLEGALKHYYLLLTLATTVVNPWLPLADQPPCRHSGHDRARGVTNFGGCSSAHGMQMLALACCNSFFCTMLCCACEMHGKSLVN
jgi:hypothetical protein